MQHQYNKTLRQKFDKVKIQPIQRENSKKTLEFKNDFQSGNLEASMKIAPS